MKNCCFYRYYIKHKRILKPIMQPLTPEQVHEHALSYEYIEVDNKFCPVCGEEIGESKEKTAPL